MNLKQGATRRTNVLMQAPAPMRKKLLARERKLRRAGEWKRWDKMEGDMHSQAEFAMFVEENVADVSDPEQGVLLEICRDLTPPQPFQSRLLPFTLCHSESLGAGKDCCVVTPIPTATKAFAL